VKAYVAFTQVTALRNRCRWARQSFELLDTSCGDFALVQGAANGQRGYLPICAGTDLEFYAAAALTRVIGRVTAP
jgi:hypothetical protein